MALPPTATAWSGCSSSMLLEEIRDVVSQPADLRGGRRIRLQVLLREGSGSDLERLHLGDPVGHRPVDRLGRAAADINHGHLALDRVAQGLGGPDEREATLLLLIQDIHFDAGDLLDLLDDLVAVLGLADSGGRDGPDGLGPHLLGEPALCGNDIGHLGDLLRGDLPVLGSVLADPRVGALLHDLPQLSLGRLRDEEPRRVRADVDRPAEHLNADSLRGIGSRGVTIPQLAGLSVQRCADQREAPIERPEPELGQRPVVDTQGIEGAVAGR